KGPDLKSLCEKSESCTGGNDKDKVACVDTGKTAQTEADDLGCRQEFDDYYTCLEGAGSCQSQAVGLPCNKDAECGGSGLCSGGQCQFRHFGFANGDKTCDPQHRALSHCGNVEGSL